MQKLLIVFVAACVLSACSTPKGGRNAVAAYGPVCTDLGFEPNTDEHRKCILHLWQQQANRVNAIINSP